jgi:hypothetical protein
LALSRPVSALNTSHRHGVRAATKTTGFAKRIKSASGCQLPASGWELEAGRWKLQ